MASLGRRRIAAALAGGACILPALAHAAHRPVQTSMIVEEVCRADEVDEELDGSEIVGWIRERGGTVDPRLEVRRERPDDPSSTRGVFATAPIREGDVLFSVPWGAVLHAPDDVEDLDERLCDIIELVAHELALGEKSDFAPYVRYLLAQRPGIIPDTWTDEGSTLFAMIKGMHLPPDSKEYSYIWAEHCGLEEPLELFAAELVVTRHDEEIMVPLYDLLNHGNGFAHNIHLTIETGEKYDVRASRDIAAGEQIRESYNLGNTSPYIDYYGTPEILRDYGFVEPIPQRWSMHEGEIDFDLVQGFRGQQLDVLWRDGELPTHESISFLRNELHRLDSVKKMAVNLASTMPKREWETNWHYLDAMATAIEHAIRAAEAAMIQRLRLRGTDSSAMEHVRGRD